MKEDLTNTVLYFQRASIGKKECVYICNGVGGLEVSQNAIIDLIALLKQTLKNIDTINEDIRGENERYWNEQKQYSRDPKPKKVKSGYVYIAKCEHTGYFKIGSTTRLNPKDRLKELQTYNPTIKEFVSYKSDDIKEEKEWHSMFENKKVSGEWFELNQSDLSIINNFYGKK